MLIFRAWATCAKTERQIQGKLEFVIKKHFALKNLYYGISVLDNQENSNWLFYYRIKWYHPQEKYSKHWAILTSAVMFRKKNSFWNNLQCIKNPNNNFKGLLCESHIILVRQQNHARIWWAMGNTPLNCLYSSQLPSKIKSPFRSLSLSVSSELANSLICEPINFVDQTLWSVFPSDWI